MRTFLSNVRPGKLSGPFFFLVVRLERCRTART
nr:MAG TPA: hypothetical protein [Microviridae sp.]